MRVNPEVAIVRTYTSFLLYFLFHCLPFYSKEKTENDKPSGFFIIINVLNKLSLFV